ncbi:MAG: hypothetical protein AAGC78_06465 [Cellvibrio sp.]|uniref:hypothetical protein n=1 Tax=Cellvibrio sp. TaxID=1965322 RepID=UPI0031A29CBF
MHTNDTSEITQKHLASSIEWLSMMSASDRWNLTDDEVAQILGIDTGDYQDLKYRVANRQAVVMTWDLVERVSLLFSISQSLATLAPTDKLALDWFNKANSGDFLKEKSIKNYLLMHTSITDFHTLNNYLKSLIR